MQRIAPLDLLRGLAALGVAIPHYFTINARENRVEDAVAILGVEVFFVLSGFVLGSQIVMCVRSGRFADLRTFLIRRWMRTIPPFLVALFVISYLTGQVGTADFLRYALYVQNLFAQHNAVDYYPVAWSLSVEEWFYVSFPLMVLIAAKLFHRGDGTFLLLAALAFIAVVTGLRAAHGTGGNWDASVRRVTVFRLDSIAYGFLLYLVVSRLDAARDFFARYSVRAHVWPALLFAVLLVVGLALALQAEASASAARALFPLVAPAFGMSAVVLFYTLTPLLGGPRCSRVCLYLGRVSYSIYLFHLIIVMMLKPHVSGWHPSLEIALYLVCLLAISTAFYRYFEKPILDARPRYRDGEIRLDRQKPFPAGAE